MSETPETVAPSAQHRFEFDTFGFTVFERVIDESSSARLGAALSDADAAIGTDYVHEEAYARHVMNVLAWDGRFAGLIDHPVALGAVEQFLGPDVILGSINARIVRPGDPDQPLHSDIPRQLRKDGRPVMVQVVWMLDPFTATNGATRVVPGSHRAPDPEPPSGVDVPYCIAPTAPAGSILVFNGQCWHGGGANRSDGIRRAVFAHYRVAPWMRFQCDPYAGFTEDDWARLTERQRRLLRMEQGYGQPTSADYHR